MRAANICIGLLAHVDAGKTTLSESILFNTGAIRKAGRVDHGDSFLDTDSEERERGITIFSKQALFKLGEKNFTLIDTPGHADFSAETERALSALDYAVLIISAPDGIHGHDITLWKLFEAYDIPVFVFVNKMDQAGADRGKVLEELNKRFGQGFIELKASHLPDDNGEADEEIALLEEKAMEEYLESGEIGTDTVRRLIKDRKLFPCSFGSALKNEGIDEFLSVLEMFTEESEYPDEFGAVVYKVTRDNAGKRLAHIKLTGGVLRPKDMVRINGTEEEKADQLILFNGASQRQLEEAFAGMSVAVTGLDKASAGSGLGFETGGSVKLLAPLFTTAVTSTFDEDMHRLYLKLKPIEEEMPELKLGFNEEKREITAKLMGEMQIQVLKKLAKDRLGVQIDFGEPSVIYKETITAAVRGAGHFEPLRHYAEAHVLIEPLTRGSGIEICSDISEDETSKNHIRLMLSVLREYRFKGTVTGAELTDVRIRLTGAKTHDKHTEGGDLREAVLRAVRQGLMKARAMGTAVLLEPYYSFELNVPASATGRAMTDIARMAESFEGPVNEGEEAVFKGRASVLALEGYENELRAYTGGFGRLKLSFDGYGDCTDQAAAINKNPYDPELDINEQSGSVFCSHGAGYYVPWYEADELMHLSVNPENDKNPENDIYGADPEAYIGVRSHTLAAGRNDKRKAEQDGSYDYLGAGLAGDKELERIFKSTLGRNINTAKEDGYRNKNLMRKSPSVKKAGAKATPEAVNIPEPKERILIVDGYNIIFAWDELKELAKLNLDSARSLLIDILANYQGFKGMTLILVFDAYKKKGGRGSVEKHNSIHVVYTEEAQTADAYIEKTVHELAGKRSVTVATNDGLEQTIIFGDGAARMTAAELLEDIRLSGVEMERGFTGKSVKLENRIEISEDTGSNIK